MACISEELGGLQSSSNAALRDKSSFPLRLSSASQSDAVRKIELTRHALCMCNARSWVRSYEEVRTTGGGDIGHMLLIIVSEISSSSSW